MWSVSIFNTVCVLRIGMQKKIPRHSTTDDICCEAAHLSVA